MNNVLTINEFDFAKVGNHSVIIKFRAYKAKHLEGFVRVEVKNKDNKLVAMYEDIKLLRSNAGKLYIKEPSKIGKNSDGTPNYDNQSLIYIMEWSLKSEVLAKITEFVETTTTSLV